MPFLSALDLLEHANTGELEFSGYQYKEVCQDYGGLPPIEQGRRAKLPRAMRFCPLCPGHHVGDERHLVFECPALQHIRQHYAGIYSDARSTMRLFMWHKDQKAMASCLLRLLSEYDSLLG